MSGAFAGIEIVPLVDHAERTAWFEANSNRDGFFYPPQVVTYEFDPRTDERKKRVERSERPAAVFHLPASHEISVANPTGRFDSAHSDEALIVYLLAFLYGTRLQLAEWRFDGRVPEKPTNNIYITTATCLHFLEHVYRWWRSLGDEEKTKFVNILYVHTRAKSLEWEWDSFIYQYIVFDALYELHTKLSPCSRKAKRHRERFEVLIGEYGIPQDLDLIDHIYKARNELFHEARWTGSTIGFGSQNKDTFYFPYHLARLNERLICNLAGYKNEFARSIWWAMGTFSFEKCM